MRRNVCLRETPSGGIGLLFWSAFVAALAFALSTPCEAQSAGSFVGTVVDKTGAVVPKALVELTSQDTGRKLITTTDHVGRFVFDRLPFGKYLLHVASSGFASKTTPITIEPAPTSGIKVTLGTGESLVGNQVPFAEPVWNVWAERYSSKRSYQPVELEPNREYSLVIDLAAFGYSEFETKAVYSQTTSPALANWFRQNADVDSVDVDILLLPDRRFFTASDSSDAVKSLHIEMAKIRESRGKAFRLEESPFKVLRGRSGSAPFDFGSTAFRIKTTSEVGPGSIAASIWINGKPIDEISLSLCIGRSEARPCVAAESTNTLKGVDLSGAGKLPDAALQLIARQSDVVGVYRCNSCGWRKDAYRAWQIPESQSWLADRMKEVLSLVSQPIDPNSTTTVADVYESAGKNLSNIIFHSSDADVEVVKKSLAGLIAKARSAQFQERPPTIFTRVLQARPDLLLISLSLMQVQLSDKSLEFMGTYANVQSPLEFQNYGKPTSCLSQWVLFVPPEKNPIPPSLAQVSNARDQFKDWIAAFRQTCKDCVNEDEKQFESWLEDSTSSPSVGIVILSHHSANSLFFYDGGSPAILSTSVSRNFSFPSIAILDACGTSQPGASEFIREFNQHGVSSVIATSTEVDPVMAGKFLALFMDQLRTHASDVTYTVSDARFDAVHLLAAQNDTDGKSYGARALVYLLAGNGALRACVPGASDH